MTWVDSPSAGAKAPTTAAVGPLIPTSTSSKIGVGVEILRALMTRDGEG